MAIVDNPDFWGYTQPGKPIKHAGYTDTYIVVEETISANSNTTVTLYTVPTGKRLMISSGIINCDKSCVQLSEFFTYDGTVPWFQINYDINYQLIDAIIGTASHEAGWILKVKLYNNLDEEVTIRGVIWGNEVDV